MNRKNVHILPTSKPSHLIQAENDELIRLYEMHDDKFKWGINKHIYITSDEEIKEGDLVISTYDKWTGKGKLKPQIGKILEIHNDYYLIDSFNGDTDNKWDKGHSKKIILTTDQDLIKDDVQAIDDEFLEWFVKNPSCDEVKVESYAINCSCEYQVKNGFGNNKIIQNSTCYLRNGCDISYKIIIPKEEYKQTDWKDSTKALMEAYGDNPNDFPYNESKQELSVRLQNSLKQFNLTLEDAINTEPHRLKQIGFGNRSIIELQSLKSKQEDEFCHYSGLPSPTAYSKSSKLDLVQLDKDIDDILAKETKESLSQWLGDKRRREQTETQEETESKWSLSKAQQFALSKFKGEGNPSKGIITWESLLEVLKVGVLTGHKFGTKWQQEQNKKLYSEGEVKKIIIECCSEISCEDGTLVGKTPEELYKWIEEKFKRK